MSESKINNLKIRSPVINKIVREDRYDTEDISALEKAYILKHAPAIRKPRTDLSTGNVVVVLEGMYTGRRGIFLSQEAENMAVVFVFTQSNTPFIFKIDEKFLFKLSSTVELPSDLKVDGSGLFTSEMGEKEKMEVEGSDSENNAAKAIVESLSKVKFMKSYLMADFKIDNTTEFYSQKY